MNLKQGAATSNDYTHAEGPFGTLDAEGFTLVDKGSGHLSLQGPGKTGDEWGPLTVIVRSAHGLVERCSGGLASAALLSGHGLAARQGIDLSHGGPVTVTALGRDRLGPERTRRSRPTTRPVPCVGTVTVDADTLIAHYRKKAAAPGTCRKAGTPAEPKLRCRQPPAGSTIPAITRSIASTPKAACISSPRPTRPGGDHAVYDIDQAVLVLTGAHLRLTTPQDVLTARDSMEYFSAKHMAVARGDAVANEHRWPPHSWPDTLVGYTVDPNAPPPAPGQPDSRKA